MSKPDEIRKTRLIIGVSGASGAIYAISLLHLLQQVPNIETHLVLSDAARVTISLETDYKVDYVLGLASRFYDFRDLAAPISSGSFQSLGMVIIPCSMKTLSGIVNSYSDNLLLRAADVVLKERRRLVLVVRESPLHLGHLRLMVQATEMGAVIAPAMPAFYHHPKTIQGILDYSIIRILDLLDINFEKEHFSRWGEQAS